MVGPSIYFLIYFSDRFLFETLSSWKVYCYQLQITFSKDSMIIDDTDELIRQKVVVLIRIVFEKVKICFFETA